MPKYSCLHTRYIRLSDRANKQSEHYVETEFYGEASLYHAFGYSVIHWHGSKTPSRFGHKMLVRQTGQGNFEPHL